MHELPHRIAVAALLAAGLITTALAVTRWSGVEGQIASLLVHRQFLLALLGAALLIAVPVSSWRLPAVAAALASKVWLFVIWLTGPGAGAGPLAASPVPGAPLEAAVMIMLALAMAVFAREAWQEARWHGVLPLRPEG